MIILIKRQILIPNLVEREVLLSIPKHQYHLSQWGECVYGAQSWKRRWLLRESMFIPIDRWTLALEMVGSKVFLMKPRHQFVYPNKEKAFMVPDQEKKGDYHAYLCLPHLIDRFWF